MLGKTYEVLAESYDDSKNLLFGSLDSGKTISFKGPKNANKSEADWNSINVGLLIQKKKSPQFFHNTTDLMNDDPQKLFDM